MLLFEKSNSIDKNLYCENIYNMYIAETSDFLLKCEEIGDVLAAKLPTGCYTNFRDALFHFRRMSKATEEMELNRQAFAIMEHANRARTDAMVGILGACSIISSCFSEQKGEISDETLSQLLTKANIISRMMLHQRLNGTMLSHIDVLRISDDQFFDVIDDYFSFVMSKIGEDKYKCLMRDLSITEKKQSV